LSRVLGWDVWGEPDWREAIRVFRLFRGFFGYNDCISDVLSPYELRCELFHSGSCLDLFYCCFLFEGFLVLAGSADVRSVRLVFVCALQRLVEPLLSCVDGWVVALCRV